MATTDEPDGGAVLDTVNALGLFFTQESEGQKRYDNIDNYAQDFGGDAFPNAGEERVPEGNSSYACQQKMVNDFVDPCLLVPSSVFVCFFSISLLETYDGFLS